MPQLKGKFDLIMFHHSFEHEPDPLKSLQKTYDLLNPGTYCVIRIPIIPSFAWLHYGTDWVQLDAPRHFFLHSRQSMEMLAAQTGFEIIRVVFDYTAFQFWGSEQYLKNIPLMDEASYAVNPEVSIFSKKEIVNFEKQAELLNSSEEGDQAIFYLKKL